MSNRGYVVNGKNTEMSASDLYNNTARPSAFSNFDKLSAALCMENKSDFNVWLKHQDAYTQQRPVRRRFFRSPYNVTNVMECWECDLLDVSPSPSTMICTDIF